MEKIRSSVKSILHSSKSRLGRPGKVPYGCGGTSRSPSTTCASRNKSIVDHSTRIQKRVKITLKIDDEMSTYLSLDVFLLTVSMSLVLTNGKKVELTLYVANNMANS